VRLLAEELLHHFLDLGHARHAADQHHFADLAGGQAGILQRLAARLDGLLDEVGHQRSNLARVSFIVRCFGPVWSAVMNGRLISVCVVDDSSILAFSAASFRRCRASLSLRR